MQLLPLGWVEAVDDVKPEEPIKDPKAEAVPEIKAWLVDFVQEPMLDEDVVHAIQQREAELGRLWTNDEAAEIIKETNAEWRQLEAAGYVKPEKPPIDPGDPGVKPVGPAEGGNLGRIG